MSTSEQCPRCSVGVLYLVTESADATGHKCLSCDYHESRVKPGYEVVNPGDPITKAGKG